MLATPNRSALILGYWIVAFVRAAITLAIVTAIGLLAGMDMLGSATEIIGIYALAAIVNLAGALFAAGVALRFRSLQATPLMMVPTFLFLFLAPVYVPRDLLAGWVGAVSRYDPLTHVMESARDLLAGQPADFSAPRIASGGRADARLRDPRPAQGRGASSPSSIRDPQRLVEFVDPHQCCGKGDALFSPAPRSGGRPGASHRGEPRAELVPVARDQAVGRGRWLPGRARRRPRERRLRPGSPRSSGLERRAAERSSPSSTRCHEAEPLLLRHPGQQPPSLFALDRHRAQPARWRSQASNFARAQRQKPQSWS